MPATWVANPCVELAYVYDIDERAARETAGGTGTRAASDMACIELGQRRSYH